MTFSSAATLIGDLITGARSDHSGLLSSINDVLGPLPAPGKPSILELRAERAGVLDMLRVWQHTAEKDKLRAPQDTIRVLFHPDEIRRFSTETGLSHPAVIDILTEMLPQCVHIRAEAMQRLRQEQPAIL